MHHKTRGIKQSVTALALVLCIVLSLFVVYGVNASKVGDFVPMVKRVQYKQVRSKTATSYEFEFIILLLTTLRVFFNVMLRAPCCELY